jgi:hypothetical protein
MMKRFVRRILQLWQLMWNLRAAVVGCFAFMRGFGLIVSEKEEPATGSSTRVDGMAGKPLAGIGAALFLLTFVTSEALVMIRALWR